MLTLSYEPECGFQHLLNDGSVTVHFPCPDKLAFEILCFSSEEVIFPSLDLQRISIVYNTDVLILIQYLSIYLHIFIDHFDCGYWLVTWYSTLKCTYFLADINDFKLFISLNMHFKIKLCTT